jgi:hypothetical protein
MLDTAHLLYALGVGDVRFMLDTDHLLYAFGVGDVRFMLHTAHLLYAFGVGNVTRREGFEINVILSCGYWRKAIFRISLQGKNYS